MMFTDLGNLIATMQNNYENVCSLWNDRCPNKINLKKTLVISAKDNADILDVIMYYRALINEETISGTFAISMLKYNNSTVTTRVKALNSIEYKIENYYLNHEDGRVPLKKCLNDLLGVRIVIDGDFTQEEVRDYLKKEYSNYKCIDSSKNGYIATHIYFERGNYFFPWELQIWRKDDERSNYDSHREYKQDYVKWERLNKGGVEHD